MESFYKTSAVALSLIAAISSAFSQRQVDDLPLFEEMDNEDGLGYYYYYYYYSG